MQNREKERIQKSDYYVGKVGEGGDDY